MANVITAQDVDAAAQAGQSRLEVPANAVITPGAADRARALHIEIFKGGAAHTTNGQKQWGGSLGSVLSSPTAPRVPVAGWRKPGEIAPERAPFKPAARLPQPPQPRRTWSKTPFYPEIGSDWRKQAVVAPSQLAPGQKQLKQLVDWDRMRSVMQKYDLDGIVAAAPHNVYYLSGLDTEPLWEFPWMSQVVVPLHGEPALILSQLDLIAPVEMELWITDLYPYGRGDTVVWDASALLEMEVELKNLSANLAQKVSGSNFEAITRALKDRGILNGRLGFDDMRIVGRLPERVNAVDAIDIMREVRMIKTEPEIELMRDAGVTNEIAALSASMFIPQAATWQEVVNHYKSAMAQLNADARYMIGGSQHHTGTHQHIHDYRPQPGDFFMVDALGAKRHYYGDFGRTVSWGEPNPEIRRRFDAMRTGFAAGLEAAKPGVSFQDLNDYVREIIRREGNTHHRVVVAHSVGLEHTDVPRRPGHVIQENMTMNIDIAYLEAGFGALHLEDTFVVRADGAELLTSGKNELIVVG